MYIYIYSIHTRGSRDVSLHKESLNHDTIWLYSASMPCSSTNIFSICLYTNQINKQTTIEFQNTL